jgi:ribonuclease BN (tRNA processing enzyme)
MEITFLGTGGGRFNLIKQVRRTGGLYLSGALRMHIDPGPGALAACRAYLIDPAKTHAVVATHNHIDHMNDASLMLEAVNCFPGMKKGIFISTASMLVGDEYGERGISSYFTDKLFRAVVARQGKPVRLGKAILMPTPVRHEDATGFGFVLDMDGCRLGYTSDTEYFPTLPRHFPDCDLLIVNCLKPARDSIGGHLYTATAARLLSECRPRLCALSHMGLSFLKAGPARQAAEIARQSGVRTIAATDGMRISIPSLKVKK